MERKRKRVVMARRRWYNKLPKTGQANSGKEEFTLPYAMDKINSIELPPATREKLGLRKDWNKKVSPKRVEHIVKTAERYKKALRELSKYQG